MQTIQQLSAVVMHALFELEKHPFLTLTTIFSVLFKFIVFLYILSSVYHPDEFFRPYTKRFVLSFPPNPLFYVENTVQNDKWDYNSLLIRTFLFQKQQKFWNIWNVTNIVTFMFRVIYINIYYIHPGYDIKQRERTQKYMKAIFSNKVEMAVFIKIIIIKLLLSFYDNQFRFSRTLEHT